MPCDYRRYPANWHEFSRRIRQERAGNKREWCGAPNGEWICRHKDDPARFTLADSLTDTGAGDDNLQTAIKVVLTVAHLWQGPCQCKSKCAIDSHVAALCQRCHLLYDLEHHKRNAAETRRRKRAEQGEQSLPFPKVTP